MKHLRYFVILSFLLVTPVFAQQTEISQIEQRIEERNQEKKKLEAQALELRRQLENVGNEKSLVSKELSQIAAERKSLENEIAQTQNEIEKIKLEAKRSESLIRTYSQKISNNTSTLGALIRSFASSNLQSDFELFLSSQKLSDILMKRDAYIRLQRPIIETTSELEFNRVLAYESTQQLRSQEENLAVEQNILGDQKEIVVVKEIEKDQILNQVKNKEQGVQTTLQKTLQMISQLDQEVRNFESTISFLLDSSKLPKKGSSVLRWPLDYVLITQRFGKTVSSERLYVSGSHSGMDFRASVGTPVYATAAGIVRGVGDTDLTCPKASFGKWVFIEHKGIGLSSTSGHLSKIVAVEGQKVKAGDVIGYTGNTGRSTAPHLHLTIYATSGVNGEEGVRITDRPSAACSGKSYRMPLAPTAAYLDPIDYLPPATASMFKHPSLAS